MVVLLMIGTISFGLDVSIGLKGGVNHSSYVGGDYKDILDSAPELSNAFNLGFQAGVFATIGLIDFLAIQPEVLIVLSGDKFKVDVEPLFEGSMTVYDKLTYLEPAVLFKARIDMFNIFVGPMIMLRLGNGKTGFKADDDFIGSDEAEYADDDFNKLVFAATGGFGILYPAGPGSLVFEVRGRYCFQNLLNEDVWITVFNQYAVMVMIGYSFPVLK